MRAAKAGGPMETKMKSDLNLILHSFNVLARYIFYREDEDDANI